MPRKTKPTAASEIARRDQIIKNLENELAALRVHLSAQALQLQFWHEHGRGMENNVRMWMGMYSEAMKTMSRLGESPVDFERQRKLVAAALEAPKPGVEALIMAVAMATSDDIDTLMARLPGMAPTFLKPKSLPRIGYKKPKAQHVSGAQAERTAIRG